MLKWASVLIVIVLALGLIAPGRQDRWRLGRLPGDARVRYRGRVYFFPFASTLLLSLLATLLLRLL